MQLRAVLEKLALAQAQAIVPAPAVPAPPVAVQPSAPAPPTVPAPAPEPAPPAPAAAPATSAAPLNDIPTLKPSVVLQKHQQHALQKLVENGGKIILFHGMGSGKANADSSEVHTSCGPKRMGSIRLGDLVIDPTTGKNTRVRGVFPQGRVDIFKVTFSDGSSTRVTADHLWNVQTPGQKHRGMPWRTLSLADIQAKGLTYQNGNSRFYIPMTEPVHYTKRELQLDPYFLGLLLGDGGLTGTGVRFTTADAELLDALRATAPVGVTATQCKDSDIDYNVGGGRGSALADALRYYGLAKHGSGEKFIPHQYLYAHLDARIAILQGLLDTDGGPSNGCNVEYCTISEILAKNVQSLVQSLGGVASIGTKIPTYTYLGEKLEGRLAYRLCISLPRHIQPFRLARKCALYNPGTKYPPTRAIVAIEPDGQEKATCISVESAAQLYLTDSYIVTHNTCSAVAGVEKLRQLGRATKTLVVTPAGLRTNFLEGGVQLFTNRKGKIADDVQQIDPTADYNVVSYEAFRKDPVGMMQKAGADTLILDEMHRIRNENSSTYQAIAAGRAMAKNFIGLTGSLINNDPAEIGPLLAISENNPALTRSSFSSKFVKRDGFAAGFFGGQKPLLGVKDPAAFAKAIYPKVDYVNTEDLAGDRMPKKNVTNVYVPMSKDQYTLYQHALGKLGPIAEYITNRDKNVTVGDAQKIFVQLMEARQVSNAIHLGRSNVTVDESARRTPKVARLVEDTVKHLANRPDSAVVLYTNLIHGGVDVLHAGLKAAGIPHALFIGKGTEIDTQHVTETVRQNGVHQFKEGKVRAIIVSGAGAEGLDLKNADAFFALDGHFNPERILQAEARARRLGGLANRPVEDRVVDVRRYQSVVPTASAPSAFAKFLGREAPRTTDTWQYDVAARKYGANRQFYEVLRHPSKYLRKETVVGKDGLSRVRYVYPEEVHQPGFLARMGGAEPLKVEDP